MRSISTKAEPSFIASKHPGNPAHHHKRLVMLVIIGCCAAYFIGNGRMPLFDRDEGWYTQISRTMLQSGNWVVPMFRGELFPGKPVFEFWCQAVSMRIFGPTPFAARYPSAAFSLFALVVVWRSVRYFVGSRRALWTVFILGTSALFIAMSKLAMMDAPLLLFVAIAQVCLAAAYSGRSNLWIAFVLWVSIALGIMTKGPVIIGTLAPTMIVLAILDIGRDWKSGKSWLAATRWWWRTQPWMAIVILPAIIWPWLHLINQRAPDFIQRTLHENMIGPIAGQPLNKRTWIPGFYLLTIWPCFMPWSLLIPVTIVKTWKNRRLAPIRFCMAAVVGPLITIELVHQQLPHYLLPLFPPLAFLCADVVVRCLRGNYPSLVERSCKWVVGLWGIIVVAITSAPWVMAMKLGQPVDATIAVSLAGIAIAALVTGFFIVEKPRAGLVTMGAGMLLLAVLMTGVLLPSFAPMNALRLAGEEITNSPGFKTTDAVWIIGKIEPSISFYITGQSRAFGRGYLDMKPPDKWPRWMAMTSDDYDALSPSQRKMLLVIGRFPSMSTGSKTGNGEIVVLRKV